MAMAGEFRVSGPLGSNPLAKEEVGACFMGGRACFSPYIFVILAWSQKLIELHKITHLSVG